MKALLINPALDLSYYDRMDPHKFNFEIEELNYTFQVMIQVLIIH